MPGPKSPESRAKWNETRRARTAAGRAARGPSGAAGLAPVPNIPKGHELSGLSSLVGPDGGLFKQWQKTRTHGSDEPPTRPPPDHLIKRTATFQRGDGSTVAQWVSTEQKKVDEWFAFWDACKVNAQEYRGLADPAPPPEVPPTDETIDIYPIGDPHIGMLSWKPETGTHFDTSIACRELMCAVRELVAKSRGSRRCIMANLGDAAHAQDDMARTPGHGNQLDVDGRFPKTLRALHTLFRGLIDAALTRHEHVTFLNLPGNHDPRMAVELMFWLEAIYEREPRVTIAPAFRAHQYDHFGTNLFGFHHGDRTRKTDLPAIMAADHDGGHTGLWGQTSEHVWYVGHEHHTTVNESPSCFVRVMNTLAPGDAFHAGRYRSKQMLEVHTYHRDFGLDATGTVSIARVLAALAREPKVTFS